MGMKVEQAYIDGIWKNIVKVDPPVLLNVPAIGCTIAFPFLMISCDSGEEPNNL